MRSVICRALTGFHGIWIESRCLFKDQNPCVKNFYISFQFQHCYICKWQLLFLNLTSCTFGPIEHIDLVVLKILNVIFNLEIGGKEGEWPTNASGLNIDLRSTLRSSMFTEVLNSCKLDYDQNLEMSIAEFFMTAIYGVFLILVILTDGITARPLETWISSLKWTWVPGFIWRQLQYALS